MEYTGKRVIRFLPLLFLSVVNLVPNVLDLRRQKIVVFHVLADFVPCVHDGGVVPSAKVLAYGNKGNALPQNVANEVDADLTGNDNFFVFLFAHKFFLFDVEVFAGSVYYVVDGDYVACRFGVSLKASLTMFMSLGSPPTSVE